MMNLRNVITICKSEFKGINPEGNVSDSVIFREVFICYVDTNIISCLTGRCNELMWNNILNSLAILCLVVHIGLGKK